MFHQEYEYFRPSGSQDKPTLTRSSQSSAKRFPITTFINLTDMILDIVSHGQFHIQRSHLILSIYTILIRRLSRLAELSNHLRKLFLPLFKVVGGGRKGEKAWGKKVLTDDLRKLPIFHLRTLKNDKRSLRKRYNLIPTKVRKVPIFK